MKSAFLIAICLILSQGIHTQFLLAKPLIRFQAQATCQGEVSQFLTELQAFMTKVSGGDFTTLLGDLKELVATLKLVYSTCIPHTLLAAGDACTGDISKLVALIPTVQAHLKAKNYIALIADFSSIKTVVDDFTAHCINQSAACVAQLATLDGNAKSTLQHLALLDQASLHTDASTLIDEIFAYKDGCIGLQGMAKFAFVASNAAMQASTMLTVHLMNGNMVQTDACQADIATVVAQVPIVKADI
jgi:hypothetical protein